MTFRLSLASCVVQRCTSGPNANIKVATRSNHGTSILNIFSLVTVSNQAPTIAPRLAASVHMMTRRGERESSRLYTKAARAWPGATQTALVALDRIAGTPSAMSAGKLKKVPPPASAFTPPANIAATKRIPRYAHTIPHSRVPGKGSVELDRDTAISAPGGSVTIVTPPAGLRRLPRIVIPRPVIAATTQSPTEFGRFTIGRNWL